MAEKITENQFDKQGVNPFNAPIPGESLTTSPDMQKSWERPPRFTDPDDCMENIYLEADKEGKARASECVPTPMVVGSPTTPLGSDIDYDKKTYYVADGICGFAWINIKPVG